MQVRDSLRPLFDLLRRIDRGDEEIVFFPDEAGSWQVCVLWDRVLPCHFRCLADSVAPEAFAEEVVGLVRDFAEDDADPMFARARAAATPAQRKALAAARTREER